MQGRRYAIALNAQVVIVVLGYKPKPAAFPTKPQCVTIQPIASGDRNRVEIRLTLPYAAVIPSHEKSEACSHWSVAPGKFP
jgi:hypothetical protein